MNYDNEQSNAPYVTKEYCRRYIDHLVEISMRDGRRFQAILIDVDDQHVTILTSGPPYHEQITREDNEQRAFGPRPGFRFRRLILPLAGIVALSTLPYFLQPYYPYPYYPYY